MKNPEEQREYQRRWVAARREAWFRGKKCAECGAEDDLHLDHIDPTTRVSHKIWSWSLARQAEELAKCQVLCAPCHRLKSRDQLSITHGYRAFKHGTPNMYDRHGCRCEVCRAWKRQKNAKRYLKG